MPSCPVAEQFSGDTPDALFPDMSAENPYSSPQGAPSAGILGLRDHLICLSVALLMWVSSAAVLASFAFGALVALIGPYSEFGGGMPDLADPELQQMLSLGGAAIIVISTTLAIVTFIRVQRGRRKTTVIGLRRAELTRAVESFRQDARRRKSESTSTVSDP